MNLQFLRYVSAVGDDGVRGNAEMVGNLLVCHALDDADNDILLTIAQSLGCIRILVYHIADGHGDIRLLALLFKMTDHGNEYLLFDTCVLCKKVLAVVEVIEGSHELIIMMNVRWQVLNYDVFEFAQLLIGLPVMA